MKYYEERKGKIEINVKSYFELKQSLAENEEDKMKNQTKMGSIRQELNKIFILYLNYLKKREIVNLVVKNFVNGMDKKVKNKYLKLEENQKKFYENGNNVNIKNFLRLEFII
ncbi:unnamed protein product [Meloidogyne enterolobii]|uniref:Uncharacterized protein n=1 Tax=Meloidogyne enterolobii TaxID=390850 RepID=A0ACB0XXK5_MELEN